MRSNKKKKTPLIYKRLLPLTILITVLFMGIGYATVSNTYLSIDGLVQSKNPTGVFIYKVEYIKQDENDITDSSIETFVDTTLSSTIKLSEDENDYETYRIYVKNNSLDNYMYLGLTYNEKYFQNPNENIIFEEKDSGEESISKGFIIEGKEEKIFQITFKYKDGYEPTQINTLSSIINFKFNPITSKIVFDPNGGIITNADSSEWNGTEEEVYKIKAVGEKYGELPNVAREGYQFEGWISQIYPGYYPVKSLSNSKGSMIESDIKGNDNNLSFYIKYEWIQLPSTGGYANLFTSYQSENHITTRIIQYGPNKTIFNINSKAANSAYIDLERKTNTIYEETLKPNDTNTFIYTSGKTSKIGTRVSATSHNNNITIFNGLSDKNFKLYNLKIYDNNELIRDYVPCISLSKLKGICDLVDNEFYYNYEQDNFDYENSENLINSDSIIEFEQKVIAQWKPNEYTITFDPNGGTVSTTTTKIKYDGKYTNLPTPQKKGFKFVGWTVDDTLVNNGDVFKYTTNKTLEANWKVVVELDTNGGALPETQLEYTSSSDTYGNLPIPTRSGYEFKGWIRKEYTEVEYIENPTGGYIETHVKGDNNNLSFEIKYAWIKLPSDSTYESIFTSYVSEDHMTTRLIQYGLNRTHYNINSKAYPSPYITKERTLNEIYTETLTSNEDGTITFTSGEDTATSERLQGTNQSSYINILYPGFIRLYYFKIYENNELIRDYIPVLNAYKEYGLYDKVNKEFIGEDGISNIKGVNEQNIIENINVTSTSTVNLSHTLYATWEKIE